MHVQPSIKRRSPTGYFARRKGRLYFIDKKKRRLNQRAG
ncbi:MAG TPA: 50S ribosomal protein L36 [Candidatus Saccharimonas sp.]|nr:50S ribosomal protein L36 [Candidatus Saccharimonas sp.]